jgi:hypothetical protein
MDVIRLGLGYRALRQRRCLTQEQLGSKARVSGSSHLSDRARPGRSRSGAHAGSRGGRARCENRCPIAVARRGTRPTARRSSCATRRRSPRHPRLELLGGRDRGLVQHLRRTRFDRHPRLPLGDRILARHRDKVGRARHAIYACQPRPQRSSRPRCRRRARLASGVGLQTPRSAERSDGSAPGRGARGDIPDGVSGSDEGGSRVVGTPGGGNPRCDVRVRSAPDGDSSTRSPITGRRPISASTSRCVQLIDSVPNLRARRICHVSGD